MKFVHITHHYIDGWGYQDNLLPKYQERLGMDVTVISDNDHLRYLNDREQEKKIKEKGAFYTIDGVKIHKIKCYLNTSDISLICKGLYRLLKLEKPDTILHHGLNSSTLIIASIYKLFHRGVKLYVDNHADWINSSKNPIWDLIYNRVLIRLVVKTFGRTVDRYFGVTPLRCDYLYEKFRVPKSKIGFLPIGCDTQKVNELNFKKEELRERFKIPLDAFVIISGGKMNRSKGTISLIEVCEKLHNINTNIHLVLFGNADEEVLSHTEGRDFITTIGWCGREKSLALLKLSDVACWPLLHTTLIEDSVACGIPLVIKSSGNVRHFEKEGNGIFMDNGSIEEIMEGIIEIINNRDKYKILAEKTREKYSYEKIALYLSTDVNNSLFQYDGN